MLRDSPVQLTFPVGKVILRIGTFCLRRDPRVGPVVPEIRSGEKAMEKNIIEISGLTRYYGKYMGIEDVSFTVGQGDIFGFVGPNGAGKTTTLRILMALIRPTAGSARIFDRDCIRQAPEIAGRVGYLPGEIYFYERMKVKELLQYTARLYRRDCRARTAELAERLQLDTGRRAGELSYGARKKTALIMALMHSPELLILDEPISGLDPLVRREVLSILQEENSRGATIVFASHELAGVQQICSRVGIIREGSMLAVHPMEELRKAEYKRVELTTDHLPEEFLSLLAVADFRQSGNLFSFMYRGDMNSLIRRMSHMEVEDLLVADPDLEEILMHYYLRGEEV